ncbi:putative fasciclin-like arabinogalactan protein 20 [Ricinus communis]|uniref:putative fasciclin-like arabinogalactan protein 20 n=1 Tax=Ricinus communis TaxID=3988 RepID=UPI00201A87EF|nr:putative fasciclin-like arabinogalactan protein 20 [Ricinus communis]
MATKTPTLTLMILSVFFFFSISMTTSLPTSTLVRAAEMLSNSGYLSMSLTLQLISSTWIIPHSPSLTIFSPSDSAFAQSGQPSLSLLQFHLCPLSFHLNSLRALPFGSKIPTLSSNLSITIVNDDNGTVFLNGVKILGCPYDDGSLVVLGVDKFLDPDFVVSLASPPSPVPVPSANLACGSDFKNGVYLFKEATNVLRSNGCSVMGSFLDLQLMSGFKEKQRPLLTVFAPLDEVMKGFIGDVDQYSLIFLRHVVPCKITWKDLVDFDDGMVFDTFLEGFGITVSRSGDILMLNEVPVSFPDMYRNEWLVVHGLRGMLDGPDRQQEVRKSSSQFLNDDDF